MEFPPEESAEEWTFEGDPGTESFLLAVAAPASAGAPPDMDLAPRTSSESRAAVLGRVIRSLESRVGPVRELTVLHREARAAAP